MPLTEADPSRVGPYRLVGRIGRGGQATVYLGVDTVDGGPEAAVKVLHADLGHEPRQKHSMERELANASKVAAGVTAKILKFELGGPMPYIASEYIEGSTLSEIVREKGALTGGVLSSMAMQTMLSLEAIHAADVVHCDFKPDNVILSPHGPRVIDFGIAMALESTHRIGEIAGTYHYMAPEQIGNARLTAAVDLFAWGCTMVYAATSQHAFPGAQRDVVMNRIRRSAPLLYDIQEPLRTLIAACLAKDPRRRPTAGQARKRLVGAPGPRRSAARPVARPQAPPPPPTQVERSPLDGAGASRLRWAAPFLATLAVGALTWGIITRPDERPGQEPEVAPSTPPPSTFQVYNADWPDPSCKPTSVSSRSGQTDRTVCIVREPQGTVERWCFAYEDVPTMRSSGQPRAEWKNIESIDWTDRWYRADGRAGTFIAYTLADGHQAAIWWESDTDPVACAAFGAMGSDEALLNGFLRRGFHLE